MRKSFGGKLKEKREKTEMKRLITVVTAVLMLCGLPMAANAQGFQTKARAAILIDASSGDVIFEHNADEPLECAGVAKTMSMLLFLEAEQTGRLALSDTVTISKHAASMRGTRVFLDSNTTHTVENLLKAVVVNSANDAAVALAEKIAGSEEVFVEMMNKKASVMGLSANFCNATGLGSEQKMSAKDIAAVCRELAKYNLAFKWGGIWMENYIHPDGRETEMVNQNRLVRFYEGCDGFATGSSTSAGYCIAATVKRSGGRFIYVSLGMPNSSTRFDDAKGAFDYAFAGFTAKTVVREGQQLGSNLAIAGGTHPFVNVHAAEEFSLLIEKGKEGLLEKELVLIDDIRAPLKQGDVIGYLKIMLEGQEVGRVDVVSGQTIDERNFSNAFSRIMVWWLFA